MIAVLVILLAIFLMTCAIFCEDIAFFLGKRFRSPAAPDIYSEDPIIESAAARLWNEMPELDPSNIYFGLADQKVEELADTIRHMDFYIKHGFDYPRTRRTDDCGCDEIKEKHDY